MKGSAGNKSAQKGMGQVAEENHRVDNNEGYTYLRFVSKGKWNI